MADEAKPMPVEIIPSVVGGISAIASANAPFVYFENAPFFGLIGGVGKVAITATRQIGNSGEHGVLADQVIVAHLVGNLPTIRALRAALDGVLLMAEPKPEGAAN